MLEIQKYLETGRPADLKRDFGINFKAYDDRIIFKYTMMSAPKFHPIVKECRGLILSTKPGEMYKVMSRGFDRFFNFGEGDDNKTFNWNNCIVFNKLDGSLIKVYHDGDKWCTSTNGTAFAEGESPLGKTYHDLFVESIGMDLQECFEGLNTGHTYIFELTSPENRIVTRYTETKATLLAVRDNITGDYAHYSHIEECMEYMKFTELVEHYDINNEKDVLKFVESRDQMDEGVVLYDKGTQQRIKVKNSAYVAIHRLKSGIENTKSIVDIIFKNEQDEFLLYFPEYTEIIMKNVDAYNNFILYINKLWDKTKDIEIQKDFALKVKDTSVSGILFGLRKGLELPEILENINKDKKINLLESFYKNILTD